MKTLTLKQMLLISHSLGVDLFNAVISLKKKDKILMKEFYRNYFNISKDSYEYKEIMELVDLGYMVEFEKNYFRVTEDGINQFKKQYDELAIYKPKAEQDIPYLRHRINFYCEFYHYNFGDSGKYNFEHIHSSYINYWLKKYKVSHTTEDVILRFKNELKKFYYEPKTNC